VRTLNFVNFVYHIFNNKNNHSYYYVVYVNVIIILLKQFQLVNFVFKVKKMVTRFFVTISAAVPL